MHNMCPKIKITTTSPRATEEIPALNQSWGRCNYPTSNWPYQGHQVQYLVPWTPDYVSPLWSDTDYWPYAPGVCSVTGKSWWIQHIWHLTTIPLRAGGVLSSRSGRAGGCQTCGTHISVTAWGIFSIRSSVELSRPVGVHCHSHMPICPIWACPWAKNLSNLPQIGSRLCGTHISETAGWIYPI